MDENKDMFDFDMINKMMLKTIDDVHSTVTYGNIKRIIGSLVKTNIKQVDIGEQVKLINPKTGQEGLAEVVGLEKDGAVVSPIGDVRGLSPSTRVVPTGSPMMLEVGPWAIGGVFDGMGNPISLKTPKDPLLTSHYPVVAPSPDPMERAIIEHPMPVGIRSIDSLLTTGLGQRIGIFGMAGCGKSSLMAMMVKGAKADVFVFGMIGERGREVREFVEHTLGEEGMSKSIMVASTSDRPSIERLKAAEVATTFAEYFRDQGLNVILFIDSVTRYARALREIGLAAGEPPTRGGYPPSVYAMLPKLMERAGPAKIGTITAFYTVLAEGDFKSDPIAEESKSILDGHILLDAKLGNAGHYPAINVLESKSRLMNAVTSKEHQKFANKFRTLLAKYDDIEMLLQVGEYQQGTDPVADEAVQKIDIMKNFLKQDFNDFNEFIDIIGRLQKIVS
ncbi:MAG: FliI/YscN family ATPase [Pseudomonadota bacterium]